MAVRSLGKGLLEQCFVRSHVALTNQAGLPLSRSLSEPAFFTLVLSCDLLRVSCNLAFGSGLACSEKQAGDAGAVASKDARRGPKGHIILRFVPCENFWELVVDYSFI
jgi:hypothetical protein